MEQPQPLQTKNDSEDLQEMQSQSVSAIRHRLNDEEKPTWENGTTAPPEKDEETDRSHLPERPGSEKSEQEAEGKEEDISESSETNREKQPGDGTEKLGNLSKIIDIGDPVIPDNVDSELGSVGSWFLAKIITDEEYPDHRLEDPDPRIEGDVDPDVSLHYKMPNGAIEGEWLVGWETITPRYETADEYIDALKRLRERYEEEKAKEDGSEAYQKHLAKLIQQVRHFEQIFRNQHEDDVDNA